MGQGLNEAHTHPILMGALKLLLILNFIFVFGHHVCIKEATNQQQNCCRTEYGLI